MSILSLLNEAPLLGVVSSWPAIATITIALAVAVHKLWLHLDHPLTWSLELLWHATVYLMPARLVYALGSRSANPETRRRSISPVNAGNEHATKSEILKDVLKLDRLGAETTAAGSGPRGLGNWDNSCFQNSVLQALSSLLDFQDFLSAVSGPDNDTDDSTLSALQRLTADLNDRSESCSRLWTPSVLKSMDSWQQQDAQEYYSKVVDQLEKDVKKLYQERNVPQDPGLAATCLIPWNSQRRNTFTRSQIAIQNQVDGIAEGRDLETTIDEDLRSAPRNPLDGMTAQRVGCLQCGYSEGLSLIPFNCLTLPLQSTSNCQTLVECLNSFTNLEPIEGVECGKCTLLRAEKQLSELMAAVSMTAPAASSAKTVQQEEDKLNLYRTRLDAVNDALQDSDFSDRTLKDKCKISPKLRVTSTKSRQMVVMRRPRCLVLHINRSIFDELSGTQRKNYAHLTFPLILDLTRWCVGNTRRQNGNSEKVPINFDIDVEEDGARIVRESTEEWEMDPARTMRDDDGVSSTCYHLQAVITHQGRHENGHYICYRKIPRLIERDEKLGKHEQWWCLSDDHVSKVEEEEVLAQSGAFMLFYEHRDLTRSRSSPEKATLQDEAIESEGRAAQQEDLFKPPKS